MNDDIYEFFVGKNQYFVASVTQISAEEKFNPVRHQFSEFLAIICQNFCDNNQNMSERSVFRTKHF